MRSLVLFILFIELSQSTFGQQNSIDSCNRIIERALQKNILTPEYDDIDSSGLALLKISKINDSILIKSIFCSAVQFNLEINKYFSRLLNRYYKVKLPNNYEVFVPIYFVYYNAKDSIAPYSKDSKNNLEKKIKTLKKKNISSPVTVTAYPMQR
jgi:hypothetical protein